MAKHILTRRETPSRDKHVLLFGFKLVLERNTENTCHNSENVHEQRVFFRNEDDSD
jgi:hypothetical protein